MSFNVAPQAAGKQRQFSHASLRDPQADIRSSISGVREEGPESEWKPSFRLYLAFLTLAVITMMVALDGTSLSVALPVGNPTSHIPRMNGLIGFRTDHL